MEKMYDANIFSNACPLLNLIITNIILSFCRKEYKPDIFQINFRKFHTKIGCLLIRGINFAGLKKKRHIKNSQKNTFSKIKDIIFPTSSHEVTKLKSPKLKKSRKRSKAYTISGSRQLQRKIKK